MNQAFIYSFKIWVTSFLVAPVLATILLEVRSDIGVFGMLVWYPRIVLGGLVFSFLSSAILIEGVYLIIKTKSAIAIKKLYQTAMAVCITLLTYYLVHGRRPITIDDEFIYYFIPYLFLIVIGIWFYKLKPVQTTPNSPSTL